MHAKIAFAGNTANQLKARFAALKKQHPHLSDRAIFALLKRDRNIHDLAERLGFGCANREVL